MENICTEITEVFLKPTSNMDSLPDISSYQPRLTTSTSDLNRYLLIGKMIGWAMSSTVFNLSLDLNIIFWKRLCKMTITIEDLKDLDIYRYQVLQLVLNGEYETMFAADLGDGEEIELIENGANIPVTDDNRQLFVQLYLEKYLE